MANIDTFNDLLNETLGALEEKGQEEQPKKKKKKKGGQNSPSSSIQNNSPSSSEDNNLNLPNLKLDEEDEKDDFEIKMEKEEKEEINLPTAEVLTKAQEEIEEPVVEGVTSPVTFEESHKKIGEEVSESYVNDLIQEQEAAEDDGGLKATVIIHTRTVTGDVTPQEPEEDYEIAPKASPEETISMPAVAPPDEEEGAEAVLLRQIQEQEAASSGSKVESSAPEPKGLLKKAPKTSKISLVRKDTGEIYPVIGKMTIGREERNDIVIEEPAGHYISGTHATIEVEKKGKVKIRERDGGTTNGTFVNGNRIGSRYIKDGDVIKLADFEMVLQIG